MLILNIIAVRLGGHLVLDHASASLPPKSRVGLVGRNGAEKSALLKIAAGVGNADDGAVETPRGTRIGHVAQEAPGGAATPFGTVLAANARRSRLLAEADRATDSLRIEFRNPLDLIQANGAPGRARRNRVLRRAASQAGAERRGSGYPIAAPKPTVRYGSPDAKRIDPRSALRSSEQWRESKSNDDLGRWRSSAPGRQDVRTVGGEPMNEAKLSVGDVYVDVKPPRREWRIRRCRDDSIMLERLDKPSVSRFLAPAELNDRNRYSRKR